MIMLHDPHFVCDLLKGRGPLAPVQVGVVVDGEVGVCKICRLTVLREVTTLVCTPVVGRRVTVALRGRQVAYRHLGVASSPRREMHRSPRVEVRLVAWVIRQLMIVYREVPLVVVHVPVYRQVHAVLVKEVLDREGGGGVGAGLAVVRVGLANCWGTRAGDLVLPVASRLLRRHHAVHGPVPGDYYPWPLLSVLVGGFQVRLQPAVLPLHVCNAPGLGEEEDFGVVGHHVHVAHVVAVEHVLRRLPPGHGEVVDVVGEVVGLLVVPRGHHVGQVGSHALNLAHEVHPHLAVCGPEVVRQVPAVQEEVVEVALHVLLHIRKGEGMNVSHVAVGQDAYCVTFNLLQRPLGSERKYRRPSILLIPYVVFIFLTWLQMLDNNAVQHLRRLQRATVREIPVNSLHAVWETAHIMRLFTRHEQTSGNWMLTGRTNLLISGSRNHIPNIQGSILNGGSLSRKHGVPHHNHLSGLLPKSQVHTERLQSRKCA
mmetsp:Transcript_19098/g.36522  ORF Transcript_19098/g.36522 Transcript_19098/m.36522 type:complete len:484 (-) Transcript_19098:175-1626(-)